MSFEHLHTFNILRITQQEVSRIKFNGLSLAKVHCHPLFLLLNQVLLHENPLSIVQLLIHYECYLEWCFLCNDALSNMKHIRWLFLLKWDSRGRRGFKVSEQSHLLCLPLILRWSYYFNFLRYKLSWLFRARVCTGIFEKVLRVFLSQVRKKLNLIRFLGR